MKQFNIFSIGNHISDGTGSVTTKSNTRGDTKWKKFIQRHPDNLYRSYADVIAQKIDANIYYLGKHDSSFQQILKTFKNSFPNIKKNFPDDINLYFLNVGFIDYKYTDFYEEQLKIEDPKERLDHMIEYTKLMNKDVDELSTFVDTLNSIGIDYNNRLIVLVPDHKQFSDNRIVNHSTLVAQELNNRAFKELGYEMERDKTGVDKEIWDYVEIVDPDIKKLLFGRPLTEYLDNKAQEELGNALYLRLTEHTTMFII